MEATATISAGPLTGRRVAFSGRLSSMGRGEAERLVRELGGVPAARVTNRPSVLVVGSAGWPLREDGHVSRKLEQAERARARGWPVRVLSEAEFLRLAGRTGEEDGARPFTLEQASTSCGVEPAEIRRWELAGLVHAREGLYDFQDLVSLRAIAELRRRGVSVRTIQSSLRRLSVVMPQVRRPLAQLQLLEADGALLARVGESLLSPCGQHVMSFEGPSEESEPVAAPADSAEGWLERGVELEERGRHAEAAEAYRRAAALDRGSGEALFNLGNALDALGRSEAAEEMLRLAVAVDPGLELAWYNLGGVLERAGRGEEAAWALRRAVQACPAFADARFNLAACLHDLGRHREAAEEWRAYLGLDPGSEWSEIARRRLEEARAGA